MSAAAAFYIGLIAIFVLLLACYAKAGNVLKPVLFTALTGFGALGLLWLIGLFLPLPVTVTPLSLSVSGVLGIPGVVFLLLFHLI